MTYAEARAAILQHLQALGWEVRPHLKVPQAVTPRGSVVRFKAQAVYVGAHSLWTDIRKITPSQFVEEVMARENGRDPSRHEYAVYFGDHIANLYQDKGTALRYAARIRKLRGRSSSQPVTVRRVRFSGTVRGHLRNSSIKRLVSHAKRDPNRSRRATNRAGYTWTEWLAAGGSRGLFSEVRMSRAWARGQDPSDWRKDAATRRKRKRTSQDPARYKKHRGRHGKARVQKNRRLREARGNTSYSRLSSSYGGTKNARAVLALRKARRTTDYIRDPGKRRIVHGRAHHGERTEHHAPPASARGEVRYELHWYSPEDRREHVTEWTGPEAYGAAKREAEEHCDRSEAKRFIRLVRLRGTGRDPARGGKHRSRHARGRLKKSLRRRAARMRVKRWYRLAGSTPKKGRTYRGGGAYRR